jgi:hypothetical protein
MSLMNLLATGRTLDTAQDAPTRYKMTQQNFLPKFAPASRGISVTAPAVFAAPANPVAPRIEAKKLETGSLFEFSAPGDSSPVALLPIEAAKKIETIPAVSVRAEKGKNPCRTPAPAFVNPFAGSATTARRKWRLHEVLFMRRKRRTGGDLIQTEWTLDKVAVVRNDLSDTDFEIVRASSAPPEKLERTAPVVPSESATATAAAGQAGETVESGASGLMRLALRFFRMKRFGI